MEKISDLNNVTIQLQMTKTLTFRLWLFILLMRLACWVGTLELELVDESDE